MQELNWRTAKFRSEQRGSFKAGGCAITELYATAATAAAAAATGCGHDSASWCWFEAFDHPRQRVAAPSPVLYSYLHEMAPARSTGVCAAAPPTPVLLLFRSRRRWKDQPTDRVNNYLPISPAIHLILSTCSPPLAICVCSAPLKLRPRGAIQICLLLF